MKRNAETKSTRQNDRRALLLLLLSWNTVIAEAFLVANQNHICQQQFVVTTTRDSYQGIQDDEYPSRRRRKRVDDDDARNRQYETYYDNGRGGDSRRNGYEEPARVREIETSPEELRDQWYESEDDEANLATYENQQPSSWDDDDEQSSTMRPSPGNFWSNPQQSVDKIRQRRPSADSLSRLESTAEPHRRRRPQRDGERRRPQRTTFRSGTPPPPSAVSDLYNRLFWYGFDPSETSSPADRTMFGGTKGKFNGLAYLQDDANQVPYQKDRRPRRPPQGRRTRQNSEEDYYYDEQDHQREEEDSWFAFPKSGPPIYDDYGPQNDWVSDTVSSWFTDEEPPPPPQRSPRRTRREEQDWSPPFASMFDSFIGVDREEMKAQAERYNRDIGAAANPNRRPRRRRSPEDDDYYEPRRRRRRRAEDDAPRHRRGQGYAYRYDEVSDDEETDIIDVLPDDEDTSGPESPPVAEQANADCDEEVEEDIDIEKEVEEESMRRRRSSKKPPQEAEQTATPPSPRRQPISQQEDDVDARRRTPTAAAPRGWRTLSDEGAGRRSRDVSSAESEPAASTQSSSERREDEESLLSWEDRAMAMERVPPADVPAWGPTGDLGMDARTKAISDALVDLSHAKQIVAERLQQVEEAREQVSVFRVDTELERKRLQRDGGGRDPDRRRSRQAKMRRMDNQVDDASRALRYAKLQWQAAVDELSELEARHWAVLSFYNPDQAQQSVQEALEELEETEPAARLYREKRQKRMESDDAVGADDAI